MLKSVSAVLFVAAFGIQSPAFAQKDSKSPEVGVGVICDSHDQVERFLAMSRAGQSPEASVQAVNLETHNPAACVIGAIAFVRNEEVGKVAMQTGVMHIVQISVLAAVTPAGWQQLPALPQYTAIFERWEEA